ncbi:methyltransferase regulatory domain-containing protein [Leclercia adecarboxylata]|uniref:O-linked N-acetylglucosamine transferase family protein n=1 Tax=Leclercia adecarboxylata TaxID=83655 RepID=UPI00254E6CB3|nr:methyltransferase regulatory domain-containing protein [Leclercia adecarboxylata]MDK4746900.1 methyltransferase regulatory domain-containing protein [Leclercia adecarboxylata]
MNSMANKETPAEFTASGARRLYSSIEHIRAAAWLYGVETARARHASVLVLGCGKGEELLATSVKYPYANIVGIELETENCQDAMLAALGSGRDNLQLYSASLETFLEADLGKFDFIIVQGSFTFLSNSLTDAILLSCQQRLSKKGIIAVDWLCQPGARFTETLRDAMQIHSSRANTHSEQIDHARAMLNWLDQTTIETSTTKKLISHINETSQGLSDELLSHHYLSSDHTASYLIEFNERIQNNGLAYVGDLRPATEHASYFDDDMTQSWLELSNGAGKILTQQYLDIAVNRNRRFSLLVHASRNGEVLESVDYGRLAEMHWAGSFRRRSQHIRHSPNSLAGHDGTPIATDDITTLGILDILGEAWPLSVSFEQLVFHTRLPDDDPLDPDEQSHRKKVQAALTALFKTNVAGLHYQREVEPVSMEHELCIAPSVTAQLQAQPDASALINLWSETVNVSDEERVLMSSTKFIKDVKRHHLFEGLVFKGLLAGSVIGWKRYYQLLANQATITEVGRVATALLLFSSNEMAGGFYSIEFERLAKKMTLSARTGTESEVDADMIIEINKLLIKGENAQARELVAEKLPILQETLNGNYYLVRFYKRVADYPAAILALTRMLSFNSTSLFIYSELAMALYDYRLSWQAGRLARAILRCDNTSGPDWYLLGILHKESRTLERAEYCARKGVELVPTSKQMVSLLGSCLCEQAKTDEGIAFLKQSIKDPLVDFGNIGSLAFIMTHSGNASVQDIFECHLGYANGAMYWARQQKFVGYQPTDKNISRKLRIGFVSGDFKENHPVNFFFLPVWDALDRSKFEIFAYNSAPAYGRNSGTDYYEKTSDGWREVQHTSTTELAEMIKQDQIDILIDLAGHTGFNRLMTFALKPAPVQISWVGYHATTGLPTMDYYATIFPVPKDPVLEAQFTEKLIYLSLPRNFGTKEDSPEINELPALKNGYFTFGSFNRPNKVNDSVLDSWAQILLDVPSARMIVANMPMVTWPELEHKFEIRGIDKDRITLREATDMQSYLKAHNEVDLLLDTFPFTGGTVTSHAAWMGVPTVSLSGETLVSRQGASIMYSLDLPEFIAYSKEEYVANAVGWTQRLNELYSIRMNLRNNMKIKHNQKESIAGYVEQMLYKCWQDYCEGREPESFSVGEIYSTNK